MTYELNPSSPEHTVLDHPKLLDEHALIGVSTFNSYFSIENMEKLFFWTHQNYSNFMIFLMDGASKFNLMAMGYDEQKALKKTRSHDNNLKNKVIKSLTNIDFSLKESERKILLLSNISQNKRYIQMHDFYIKLFKNNNSFKNDCLEATRMMLSSKINNVDDHALYLAVKYILAEFPLWLNTPYVLNINSSSLVYKDLSSPWQRICYDYNLLSPNQKIMIKSVLE